MVEYGYMEGDYLRSKILAPIIQNVMGTDGKPTQITISIEEQINKLSSQWKPVDKIDDSMMESDDEDYIIVPKPYDAGERIAFAYIKKFDRKKVLNAIQTYKDALSSGDYKIIKCYECYMLQQTLPYDLATLTMDRQILRDKINALENKLLENA